VAKLVPLGTMTLENKGVKLAQLNQFSQTWLPFPFFKKLEAARKIWLEMGFPEPDSILFSDEEMKSFNDFQKQMMGQGGNMGSPQPGQPPQPGGNSPFAGGTPPPSNGMIRLPMPQNGPGVSPLDLTGAKV